LRPPLLTAGRALATGQGGTFLVQPRVKGRSVLPLLPNNV